MKVAGASSVALITGLAGCSGGDGDDGDGGDGSDGGTDGGDGSDGGTDGDDGGSGTTTSTDQGPDTFTIGSNHPLSGGLSYVGKGMDNAVKLAAKHKNAEGGIESLGGAQVEVLSRDNEGAQELGGQVEKGLIDDGASAVTGCFSSPTTASAVQVAERQGVPHVIDVAAADSIIRDGMSHVYRVHGPSRVSAYDFSRWVPKLIRDGGNTVDTAAVVAVNNNYGQSIAEHLTNYLPDYDVDVVLNESVEPGASTADTTISSVRNADPDMVTMVVYGGGGLALAEAMKNQEYQPPFLTGCASPAFSNTDTLSKMGADVANGVMNNNFALNPTIDRTEEIKSEFQEFADRPLSALAGMGYTAANVIFAAVENAGTAEPAAINDALKTVRVEDHIQAMPPIEFANSGENPNAITPLTQVQDLGINLVYPPEFADGEPQV